MRRYRAGGTRRQKVLRNVLTKKRLESVLSHVVDLGGKLKKDFGDNAPGRHHRECLYEVKDARYASGMKAVKAPSEDGFKSKAANLLSALKFRYSNRERAFIGSPSKVTKFEKLCREGWDAEWDGTLIPPEESER